MSLVDVSNSNILDAYQRGNRDGLLTLAKWAEDMAKQHQIDTTALQESIARNSLTALRYEVTISGSLARGEVYKHVASQARRMAEALPLDPENNNY